MPWRIIPASRRAPVRAAFIAYFVFFNVLAALPTLGTPSAERLERPFEQDELRRWAGLLDSLGVKVSTERLAQLYLALSSSLVEAREVALWPIEGWMSLTRSAQAWRLFGTPDEIRNVLRISAYGAAQEAVEQVLYESGDPERRWNAELLEYRRIRAAYNPSHAGPPSTYAGLGERLSQEIFGARPDVQRVRIRIDQSRIALPGQILAGQAPGSAHEEQYVLEFARPSR
ncbi:MAG: hypothetical protein ABI895_12340 [Deltaproteobacteria bacterium]